VEIGAIRAGRILQAGPGNGLHSKLKIEASMGWALARGELDNKKKPPSILVLIMTTTQGGWVGLQLPKILHSTPIHLCKPYSKV